MIKILYIIDLLWTLGGYTFKTFWIKYCPETTQMSLKTYRITTISDNKMVLETSSEQ